MDSLTLCSTVEPWRLLPATHERCNGQAFSTRVENLRKVLTIACDALNAFQQRDLDQFDPLVMECCCQIRAVMYTAFLNNEKIGLEVQEAKERLHAVAERIVAPKHQRTKLSLQEFIQEERFNTALSGRVYAIVLGYLLTITKQAMPDYLEGDRTNYHALGKRYGLGSNVAKIVNLQARCALSTLSVCFVQQQAEQLGLPTDSLTEAYVRVDIGGVRCLPCFALSDVMLRTALSAGLPLILRVNRHRQDDHTLIDQVTAALRPEGKRYVAMDIAEHCPETPVWVWEGYSYVDVPMDTADFQALLITRAKHIFRGSTAAHSQYSVQYVGAEAPADPRREKYRQMALADGFCRDNPSHCELVHIFASTLRRQHPTLKCAVSADYFSSSSLP